MQNREFEKSVQQQMEELKLVPSDALWDKVEAALPAEKKPRRWMMFILVVAALFTGSLLLKQYFTAGTKKEAVNSTARIDSGVTNDAAAGNTTGKQSEAVAEKALQINDKEPGKDAIIPAEQPAAEKTGIQKVKHTNADNTAAIPKETDAKTHKRTNKGLYTKATVKIKVKAPQPVNDNAADDNAYLTDAVTPATVRKEENNAADITVTPSAPDSLHKKDTAMVVTAAAKPVKEKNTQRSKWQYGVYLSAGSAAVKNGVFSKQPVTYYAAGSAVYSQPGAGVSNNNLPAAPSSAAAFAVGFVAEKNINPRWKFVTGINYMYQSNTVWVGKKVDSAVAVNIDANKSITAPNYYTAGFNEKYKNSFHLIDVPLLFQYRPVFNLPVYIEGGVSASALLYSNALVYNTAAAAFITDPAVFNRLQFSANAGAGFTFLQKTKYPVSMGYQFRQGLLSVSKPAFGKQYFLNSLLYARISFKK